MPTQVFLMAIFLLRKFLTIHVISKVPHPRTLANTAPFLKELIVSKSLPSDFSLWDCKNGKFVKKQTIRPTNKTEKLNYFTKSKLQKECSIYVQVQICNKMGNSGCFS